MLVLTRQRGEHLVIGDDIAITLVDIRGDKVRLGITAPKDAPIVRHEILSDTDLKALDIEVQRAVTRERRESL